MSPFVKTTASEQYLMDVSLRKVISDHAKSKINRKILKNLINSEEPDSDTIKNILKSLKSQSSASTLVP